MSTTFADEFNVTISKCSLNVFDALFEMDLSKLDVDKCVAAWPSLEEEQERAKRIYADFPVPTLGYEEITKKWQPKEEVRVQLQKVKDTWPEFKKKLQAQVWSFEKMRDMFRRAGAPTSPEEIGVTRAELRKGYNLRRADRGILLRTECTNGAVYCG